MDLSVVRPTLYHHAICPKSRVLCVQADGGEEKLKAAAADWDLVELLKSDPEFDPADLPSVPELLKAEGLQSASK